MKSNLAAVMRTFVAIIASAGALANMQVARRRRSAPEPRQPARSIRTGHGWVRRSVVAVRAPITVAGRRLATYRAAGDHEQERRAPMPKRRPDDDRPRRNVRFTNRGYSVDPREILESKSGKKILRQVRDNFPVKPATDAETNR